MSGNAGGGATSSAARKQLPLHFWHKFTLPLTVPVMECLRGRALPARALLVAIVCSGSVVGCGDDAVGPNAQVSRLVIVGVPDQPLVPGASVALAATATDGNGDTISGAKITWSSSMPGVAEVAGNGKVMGRAPGSAEIVALAGRGRATVTIDVAEGGVVGPAGGTVLGAGGKVELVLAPGALQEETPVIIRELAEYPPGDLILPAAVYEVAAGLQFAPYTATLSIFVDPAAVPPSTLPEMLQIYGLAGRWVPLSGSRFDTDRGAVVMTPWRGVGTVAVGSTPLTRLEQIDPGGWTALYVGQRMPVVIAGIAPGGEALPLRQLDWSSSNPAVASVDDEGMVTAHRAGETTISGGLAAGRIEVPVTVLPRQPEDWTRATDWVTQGGGFQHSGYVDVTLDPDRFEQRWAVEPIAGHYLHQAVTGDGGVFVASFGGSGARRILRLDPATGQVQASATLSTSEAVNQPTFHAGELIVTHDVAGRSTVSVLSASTLQLLRSASYGSDHAAWEAPVATGATVITAGADGVYGLDLETLEERYRVAGPSAEQWGPTLGPDGRGWATLGALTAFSADDGETLAVLAEDHTDAAALPLLTGGTVLTLDQGWLVAIDAAQPLIRWETVTGHTGRPVGGNGVVYVNRGNAVEARRASDGVLLWTWSVPGFFLEIRSLLLTNNLLLASVEGVPDGGRTFAIDVTSGQSVWSGPVSGQLALGADGTLYVTREWGITAVRLR